MRIYRRISGIIGSIIGDGPFSSLPRCTTFITSVYFSSASPVFGDISEGEGADLGNNLYTITFPKPAHSMTGVTFDGASQLQERCDGASPVYVLNTDG